MVGGFWALGFTHNPSLSAMRTPPLRMAEKAGAWGGESDAPALRRGSRIKPPMANQPWEAPF